jgi:hypothetical protein
MTDAFGHVIATFQAITIGVFARLVDSLQPALFTADDPGDLLIEQEPRN